jgi:hypothetical protein
MSRPKKSKAPKVIVNGEEQPEPVQVKRATPEERARIAKMLQKLVAPKLPGG